MIIGQAQRLIPMGTEFYAKVEGFLNMLGPLKLMGSDARAGDFVDFDNDHSKKIGDCLPAHRVSLPNPAPSAQRSFDWIDRWEWEKIQPDNSDPILAIFDEAKRTYETRTATYRRGDRVLGRICAEIWPDGITLRTAEDFTRFYLFAGQILGKVLRYGMNFTNGGHKDSAHDTGVYSFMLEAEDAARDHNGQ